jgi:hypothetical protein
MKLLFQVHNLDRQNHGVEKALYLVACVMKELVHSVCLLQFALMVTCIGFLFKVITIGGQ